MLLCFTLSMPGVNSWNGKWSGEGTLYAKIIRFSSKKDLEKANKLLKEGYFHYNFGDGWAAGIEISLVNSSQAAKIRKKSQGFCSYDWMVDSILRRGKILNSLQEKELTLNMNKGEQQNEVQG